jgi:hypothetical protein
LGATWLQLPVIRQGMKALNTLDAIRHHKYGASGQTGGMNQGQPHCARSAESQAGAGTAGRTCAAAVILKNSR